MLSLARENTDGTNIFELKVVAQLVRGPRRKCLARVVISYFKGTNIVICNKHILICVLVKILD